MASEMMQSDVDIFNDPLFKKAIVAAAFSPRLTAVLNESHYLLKSLGAWPIIVHVGEKSPAVRVRLDEAVDRSDFKEHPPICVIEQGSTAEVLIGQAKAHEAELIVAGALAKEGVFKYYMGSVARTIARQASCSVYLFTEPQPKPHHLNRIHCLVDYDQESYKAVITATQLAMANETHEICFTHSFTIPNWEEKRNSGNYHKFVTNLYKEKDRELARYLEKMDIPVRYDARCLHECSRTTTLDFTREIQADLLIVPARQNSLGFWERLTPQKLDRTLQHLPCSLMLIR